jgi:hypothetical protein
MNVRIAVLADYASLSIDQKLNILGIFTGISAHQTPVVHPQMKLVSQIEFSSSEVGDKRIKIALVDDDGLELFSISGIVTIDPSLDGRPSLFNQILDLTNLTFPRFGDYEFRLLFDGITISEVPLTVTKITASSAGNPVE